MYEVSNYALIQDKVSIDYDCYYKDPNISFISNCFNAKILHYVVNENNYNEFKSLNNRIQFILVSIARKAIFKLKLLIQFERPSTVIANTNQVLKFALKFCNLT